MEENSSKNQSAPKPLGGNQAPPIFVTWYKKLKSLRTILNDVAEGEYNAKYIGNSDVMVQAFTPESYTAILRHLKKRRIRFFLNQFLPEKDDLFKVILRGLEYNTEPRRIFKDLKKMGHKIVNMSNVVSQEGELKPLFVIKLEKRDNNNDIFNIKRLFNTNVVFESPSVQDQFYFYTKCDICQDFGHTSKNCPQLNCALCSEAHDTIDCPLNMKSLHMKCFECGRAHSPTYDCALVLEVEEKRAKEKDVRKPPTVNFLAYPPIPAVTTLKPQSSVLKEPQPEPKPKPERKPEPEPEPSFPMPKLSYAQMAKTPIKTPPKPEPLPVYLEPRDARAARTRLIRPKPKNFSLRLPPPVPHDQTL